MDILIIIVLIVAAVILFLVELFVIPGISIAGILAGACMIYANYYAFAYLGTTAGFITLGVSAIACIGSLILFMHIEGGPYGRGSSKSRRYGCGHYTPGTDRQCRNRRQHRGSEIHGRISE